MITRSSHGFPRVFDGHFILYSTSMINGFTKFPTVSHKRLGLPLSGIGGWVTGRVVAVSFCPSPLLSGRIENYIKSFIIPDRPLHSGPLTLSSHQNICIDIVKIFY